MSDAVDVNIVFASLHPRHVHAPRVRAWLATKSRTGSLLVCRMVHIGALRLLTQPRTMKKDGMDTSEFWRVWDL